MNGRATTLLGGDAFSKPTTTFVNCDHLGVLDGQGMTPVCSLVWGRDLSGTMQGLPREIWRLGHVCGLHLSDLCRSCAGGDDHCISRGEGGLLATVIHTGTNAGTYFYAYDGNGNVAGLVNAATGEWAAQYECGPFGEVIRATGPMAKGNPFRWSTQYTDDETDLVMYPARPYNPSTGRFLCKDPIAENGGLNLYAFVRNNPVNRIDPLGLAEASGTISPWQMGWEWLTGTGEQHRDFGPNDRMTQDLRRSPQIQAAIAAAKKALAEKCKGFRPGVDYGPYPVDAQGDASNDLSGLSRPFKYIRDYSVIVTGVRFGGNLTVTFLGSFQGDWRAVGDCCTRKGQICFTVVNRSSLASGTRFPITGYWSDDYTATLWEMITFQDFGIPSGIFPSRPDGSTGPGRTTSQTFKWCEDIGF